MISDSNLICKVFKLLFNFLPLPVSKEVGVVANDNRINEGQS